MNREAWRSRREGTYLAVGTAVVIVIIPLHWRCGKLYFGSSVEVYRNSGVENRRGLE